MNLEKLMENGFIIVNYVEGGRKLYESKKKDIVREDNKQ